MKQKLLLLLLLGLAGRRPAALGQTVVMGASSITTATAASGTTTTFSSAVAGVSSKTIWDMLALNKSALYSFDATQRAGSISATLITGAANAAVTVTLYRYDPSLTGSKGIMLFSYTKTAATAATGAATSTVTTTVTPDTYSFGALSSGAVAPLVLHDFGHYVGTRPFFLLSTTVPAIVEITVSGAVFTSATVPGIGVCSVAGAAARTAAVATATGAAAAALPLALELFPNPAQGRTTLHVTVPAATAATADLLDLQGRRVLRQPLKLQAGENYQEMPLGNVAAGLYLLEVRLAGSAGKPGRLVQRLQVE